MKIYPNALYTFNEACIAGLKHIRLSLVEFFIDY